MVATITNVDTANLFVGDDDPSNSQFLVLNNFTLPDLQEATKSYTPGGGIGQIEMGMRRVNAMTMPFSLHGIQEDVLSYFMRTRRVMYTIRGNLSNISDQTDKPFVATIEGRMTKATLGQFSKDNGMDTDYEIREIMRYKLVIGTTEKIYFDQFLGPRGFRIDGIEPFRDVARNIGLI
jgi:phage tail tube protein FII